MTKATAVDRSSTPYMKWLLRRNSVAGTVALVRAEKMSKEKTTTSPATDQFMGRKLLTRTIYEYKPASTVKPATMEKGTNCILKRFLNGL